MSWIESLLESPNTHDVLLWWLFAASLAMFLMTPILVGATVVRLPADYFTAERRTPLDSWQQHMVLRITVLIVKNLLGIVLVLAGILMLVVPGQGLLTFVAGLILVDFPGKFRFERWLVTRAPVWRSINWLRKRAGREPMKRPQ